MILQNPRNAITPEEAERVLGIAFLFLLVLPLLYIFRFADDNTFTSWRWVFSQSGILKVFLCLIPALLCAFALSRLKLTGSHAYAFIYILSFIAVIPLWQTPESIIDASRYFIQAKYLKEHGIRYFLEQWGNAINSWTDMPLAPFLYGLVFSVFGESRLYIQLLNTALFALTAVLTFSVGKELWDEETGLHAGLLLLGIPYLLTQAPLMLVDVPAMFFLTLSIHAFLNALEKGGLLRTVFASLALCMALFSKYSAGLMLFVIPVIAVVFAAGAKKKIFIRTASVFLLAGLFAAVFIFVRYDLVRDQIMLLSTYQWSGLSRWQEGYISTFIFQTHPFLALLALCGIYRACRNKDKRFLIPALFAVFVIVLQIKRIRYIIPMFPLFVLMASYGLHLLRDKGLRRFIVMSIVASSLVIAFCVYLPFLNTTGMANLKNAGQYLNTLDCGMVEVYALPQVSSSGSTFAAIPILDFHTDRQLILLQDWPGHLQNSVTQRSSLRFTWETEKPGLYSLTAADKGCVAAIISSEALDRIPEELIDRRPGSLRELKRFDLASEVFKYQTYVTIYKRE